MSDQMLKPCPHCGMQPSVEPGKSGELRFILCPEVSSCRGSGLSTGFLNENETEAIAAWNDRALPADPVAYLDLGVGGYVDIGLDLTDEQIASMPKGRHMLGIIGTYGVDGYVAAPAPQEPSEEAERFIQALIDTGAEPFRRLGEYLAPILDGDQWKHAESLLLGGLKAVQDGRDLQGDIDHYNENMR